ncbi:MULTISPECIES: glycogen/starch/alpha-glucan phosphorylase [unclassified Enterococcus]|uniref:glycogen/starch/alpha-glucan phosphorylase n=1 Tax=unclassified Enterococcus TaxID=2608891 RepID=UPI0015559C6D|nr:MULTISPECIES: glycogen/starch/alpha-glucan phosphorylase [unclassified Enterococcus]MBS7577308.1 glycogen/starch/alpha-glucan phosphorylase [Enterococcus sp. MMGLQ5-2]MBS7584599.1 glycogen/starch/alpha-glucan phosphorylase [Enterococcus sp. MMGLQ5-1]NPD12454.1 glycogen/starch/alpha-glucan phosphorylase [Enterococcus sp. MMGLQ5-1]NPD37142.1 glycogen/starch/alpha-glucan phosphorylase [Enterococcus sp. MMGLQ5-2]
MQLSKEQFTSDFKKTLHETYAIETRDANNEQLFIALAETVKAYISASWREEREARSLERFKIAYYFSIEFLPGKMLKSNLLNLGILETVRDSIQSLDLEFDDIAKTEKDMALGNGGLGRLASCFMDSLASCALPGFGNGIRYQYGLFKQKFVNGYQVELPDAWLESNDAWEVKKLHQAVNVNLFGHVYLKPVKAGSEELVPVYENPTVVRAVPYDTAMVGYQNDVINNLRLWDVEIPEEEEQNYHSIEDRRKIQDITSILYPDDSTYEGRKLRLVQEYFFVSAGIQSIVRDYLTKDLPLKRFAEKVAIHINDTHPALSVAELMRILVDEQKMAWDAAWQVTVATMSYTNHTIMQEALEKWPMDMLITVIPRIYQIIAEIDARFVKNWQGKVEDSLIWRTKIIQNDQVHMANLAIIGSHSTNGVAKIHSDLLTNVVLHDFYLLYPERFNNKTNGIALRRWLQLANEPLSNLLDETIGNSWRFDHHQLAKLADYQADPIVLSDLAAVKLKNKTKLARYIFEITGITVNPHAIFDVQVKRLHAYKRQLLNLMHIVKLYQDLKANPDLNIVPRVFIFGAKAAPSYYFAKSVIKVINEVANLINQDEGINDKLKVIFLENYNVSLAELIIPAADISEQISLASKEASGTSNMKLMANGAITVATLDGANIEIKDAVGDENIIIFGLDKDEVYRLYGEKNYHAWSVYNDHPDVKRVVDAFIDGSIPNIHREGQEIYDSLIKYNDEYFVLLDFLPYVEAQEKINVLYQDELAWQRASLINIASGGKFSSDDTIKKYADEIWHIKPTSD